MNEGSSGRSEGTSGRAGGLRVLVAESDARLRRKLVEAFQSDRCDVHEFEDAASLMSALAEPQGSQEHGPVQLIVASLELRGSTGTGLLDELTREAQDVPLVFTTHSHDHALRTRAMTSGGLLFDKPFNVPDLVAAARWALRTCNRHWTTAPIRGDEEARPATPR